MMDIPAKEQIRTWANELGFSAIGVSGVDLSAAEPGLESWLQQGFHGQMDYMAKHGLMRARPEQLLPGTRSVISASLAYSPEPGCEEILQDPEKAFISRYALGRDYHKVMKKKLEMLAARIRQHCGGFNYRVFTDSAPVLEAEIGKNAGLGWRGKNTLLLSRQGSWFFLGEIYCDLALAPDAPVNNHCGSCDQCIRACPTQAIVAPGLLDARRCISYLTIELKGSIPLEFRKLIGNRIYGCDDCQLCCPWNRFAGDSLPDFFARNSLDGSDLLTLFSWDEAGFRRNFAGSAILRLGHERWLRNIAVALGNGPSSPEVLQALRAALDHPGALLREHVAWALAQLGENINSLPVGPG